MYEIFKVSALAGQKHYNAVNSIIKAIPCISNI